MEVYHLASEGTILLTNLDLNQFGRGKERERRRREIEKERVFRERGSTFSLSFPTIGPVAGRGARGRVDPHSESFASRPVLGSFDKLQKCRGFSPTCFTFCLRAM